MRERGRHRRRIAFAVALGSLLSHAVAPHARAETVPMPGGDQCLRTSGLPAAAADQLVDGFVEIPPFPPYEIGADPDWSVDPFRNTTWVAALHSLLFTDVLREAYLRTEDPAYLARWQDLVSDWIDDNPAAETEVWQAWGHRVTGVRAQVLACALDWLPTAPAWRAGVVEHGRMLETENFYARVGNHALEQNLGLLAIGCKLAEPLWTDLAVDRTLRLADESIDPAGGINEGSIAYARFNHDLYGEAETRMEACELTAASEIAAARSRLARFIVHGTLPDGRFVRIGDVSDGERLRPGLSPQGDHLLTHGASGQPMASRRAWFSRTGWMFDRSSWTDPRATHIALRTGRVELHNHQDQGSFVVSGFGRRLLDEAGLFGYFTPLNTYFQGPAGHNVLFVDGRKPERRPAHVTRLRSDRGWAFRLDLPIWGGVRWRRTISVLQHGRLIIVADHATTRRPRTFRQLWHLATGSRPVHTAGTGVRTRFDRGNLAIAIGGDRTLPRIVSGQRTPTMQGWIGTGIAQMHPAPVLEAIRRDVTRIGLVTVLAIGPNDAPDLGIVRAVSTRGGFDVTFDEDGRRWRVRASGDAVTQGTGS